MNYICILDDLSATTIHDITDVECTAINQGGIAVFRATGDGFEQLDIRAVPGDEPYWAKTWRKV